MTLNEIEQDIYRRLNKYTASPDTATQTRIRAFVNQRHRELLTLPDCQQLRDDVTTFATVSGTYRYALPQAIARIHRMWDATNQRTLSEQSMGWFRAVSPDPTVVTGNPEAYAMLGQMRVAAQPASASSLFVKSTSASDVQVARIEGVITGGYQQTASATLTGTTAVQLGSLATWIQVDNIYLATAAVGTVTLTQSSGAGTELARIATGETMPRYWTILLWPTPTSAITMSVDYAREVLDMAQSTDEPLLPPDFHRLLVYGACMDECVKIDDERYAVFQTMYERGKNDMLYFLHARASFRPGARTSSTPSNLGSMFPGGRW